MLSVFLAASTAATTEGNGWGGKLPIIPHPAELIIGIVFFIIVYWAVNKYFVPRFEAMYAERTASIEGGMAKAEEAQAEAEAALQEYRSQLAEAQAEAGRIREQARTEGAQIKAELREQAQAEAREARLGPRIRCPARTRRTPTAPARPGSDR